MKRVFNQKSHPYEVYNKSYDAIFSMLGHKVIHIFNLIQQGNH